jgi:hypothetical protein
MHETEMRKARQLAQKLFAGAYGIRNRDENRLIIDRRYWGRGEAGGNSLLASKEGQPTMCCLGFLCIERGMSTTKIFNASTPTTARANKKGHTIEKIPKGMEAFMLNDEGDIDDTPLTSALVDVNDALLGRKLSGNVFKILKSRAMSHYLKSERHREQLITRLFRTADIEVTFVN